MDISCAVCLEVFTPDSVIVSTRCGHAFHQACMIEFRKRAKTCPQCNMVCTANSTRRLYLNIAPQNQKDPLELIESLRKTIEIDQLKMNKRMNEMTAKLRDTEDAKVELQGSFQTELQCEQEIRWDLNEKLKIAREALKQNVEIHEREQSGKSRIPSNSIQVAPIEKTHNLSSGDTIVTSIKPDPDALSENSNQTFWQSLATNQTINIEPHALDLKQQIKKEQLDEPFTQTSMMLHNDVFPHTKQVPKRAIKRKIEAESSNVEPQPFSHANYDQAMSSAIWNYWK